MNIILEGRFTLSYHINKCLFRHDSSNIYSLEHISLLIEPCIWIKYTCIHKTDTKKGSHLCIRYCNQIHKNVATSSCYIVLGILMTKFQYKLNIDKLILMIDILNRLKATPFCYLANQPQLTQECQVVNIPKLNVSQSFNIRKHID